MNIREEYLLLRTMWPMVNPSRDNVTAVVKPLKVMKQNIFAMSDGANEVDY